MRSVAWLLQEWAYLLRQDTLTTEPADPWQRSRCHLSSSLASPLFPKGVGLWDNLASSSIIYLPMHCLGLKRQHLCWKTALYNPKLWHKTGSNQKSGQWKGLESCKTRGYFVHSAIKIESKIEFIANPVYSPVKSPGFVPTHSHLRCT